MIAVTGGLAGTVILMMICGAITGILIDRLHRHGRDRD